MQNKKVFILLVVLALLFVLAMATNLFRPKNRENADSYDRKDSWVATMDNLMAKFYPTLDANRLTPLGNGCQSGDGAYLLDTEESCKFFIKRADGEKYQTATLEVDRGVTVRMAVYDREEYQGQCSAPDPNTLELMVDYLPAGESEGEPECWTTQKPDADQPEGVEVRLVVMEKGGRLLLSCPTCDESKHRRIKFAIQ